MRPYYQRDGVTIYHGDCREWLPDADVLLSDPPYGINHPTDYKSRGRGGWCPATDYSPVYGDNEEFKPSHLLNYQSVVLWGANYYAQHLDHSSGWLVWDKLRPNGMDQADVELAWTNCVKGARRFRYLWNGAMRDGQESLHHPTQKPVALMEWVLGLKWITGGTVLDPYMGAGATLIAAKNLNRKAIGIEIEERYCEIAAKRLSQGVLNLEAGG